MGVIHIWSTMNPNGLFIYMALITLNRNDHKYFFVYLYFWGHFVDTEAVGIIYNKQQSVYCARIFLYPICISNRE